MRSSTYVKWDQERLQKAMALLRSHQPEYVAKELGLTESSLRAALQRNGIKLSDYRRGRLGLDKKGWRGRQRAFVKPNKNPLRVQTAMQAFDNDPGGCRFPMGELDKGNFRFCGRDAEGTYCEAHHKRTHIVGSASMSQEAYERHVLQWEESDWTKKTQKIRLTIQKTLLSL